MLTFVTGNASKAKEVERYLGIPISYTRLDLPEIQSLDHKEVVEAKAREAFTVIGTPVIVDDSGLSIDGMNGLPGTFVKWFEIALGTDGVARLADAYPERTGSASVTIGYFDGTEFASFSGEAKGTIADHPRGEHGFGFDVIFIHEGDTKTRAELTPEEQDERPIRKTALEGLKTYLAGRGTL